MFTLKYEFKNNIPVFRCNFCGKCNNVLESTSKIHINRGCCWYFPKYTLVDIKNILDNGRKDFILKLLKNPNSHISQYHIQVKGLFDEKNYNQYMLKTITSDNEKFNHKLFFRACPFIGPKGCTLDFSIRPHPCNLYLCRTVINLASRDYDDYKEERKDYFSYCNYFDESIEHELLQNHVNLISNPLKCLDIIEKFDLPKFQFRNLKEIKILTSSKAS